MKRSHAPSLTWVVCDRRALWDRLVTAGLLIWALPDVPWWWRPAGHSRATPVVLALIALALAQSIPFLWRRRFPGVVLAVAGACLAIKAGAGLRATSAEAAVLVAAYGCGNYGGVVLRIAARVGAAVSLLTAVVLVVADPGYQREVAIFPALLTAAFGVGEAASARRAAIAAEVVHAQDEERARIARELHDVVAHHLSAIAVQAGAARVAASSRPSVPEEAVGVIEATARDALIDLNAIVGTLRRTHEDWLDRAPQPSVTDLPDLIERARRAGLPVTLAVQGEVRPVSTAVGLAAYRTVQEGVTNAIRYAKCAPTRVDLVYSPRCLTVSVEDDGPSSGDVGFPSGGRGLAGLGERLDLVHGSLEAGPSPGGGYRLVAQIPSGP